MAESLTSSKKLEWKWVGITLILYAVFYLLPLFFLFRIAEFLGDAWLFSGIIIIAAVAAYLSKGITIWEPPSRVQDYFCFFHRHDNIFSTSTISSLYSNRHYYGNCLSNVALRCMVRRTRAKIVEGKIPEST